MDTPIITHSNRVRFQGGPLHNHLGDIRDYTHAKTVVVADEQQALLDGHTTPHTLWLHQYQLVSMQAPSGCQWLEYHYRRQPSP